MVDAFEWGNLQILYLLPVPFVIYYRSASDSVLSSRNRDNNPHQPDAQHKEQSLCKISVMQILIKRAQNRQNDPAIGAEAVGELYDRYHESIYRYIWLRVSDQHLAEDLTGDVFTRMVINLPNYRSQEHLSRPGCIELPAIW